MKSGRTALQCLNRKEEIDLLRNWTWTRTISTSVSTQNELSENVLIQEKFFILKMILLVAISHVNGYFAVILWLFPISKPRYKKKLIQKCYFKDWNSHISPYVAVFIQALRIFRKEGTFFRGRLQRKIYNYGF